MSYDQNEVLCKRYQVVLRAYLFLLLLGWVAKFVVHTLANVCLLGLASPQNVYNIGPSLYPIKFVLYNLQIKVTS